VAIPAPASTAEAKDMVLTGLSYLAAADPTALAIQAQAECLQAFEQADAISTAGPDPGRVHRQPGLLGRRGLQPDLLADAPHPHH
jgi:hypothetical protein